MILFFWILKQPVYVNYIDNCCYINSIVLQENVKSHQSAWYASACRSSLAAAVRLTYATVHVLKQMPPATVPPLSQLSVPLAPLIHVSTGESVL